MIKDRRPYFIRNLIENYYKFWTYYFIKPQFRSVGKNLDINKPWNLDIYGDDIFVGNNVHFRTSKNLITQICSWNRNDTNARILIGDNVLISLKDSSLSALHGFLVCTGLILFSAKSKYLPATDLTLLCMTVYDSV